MKVLDLINQYPKNSHTFVRREIRGVEDLGIDVVRVSIRPAADDLVDAADQEETKRTSTLLESGAKGLLPAVVAVACTRPLRFLSALRQTFRLAKGAERSLTIHLAYFAEACALLRICQNEKVDHVHVHFGTNPPLVAMLTKMLGGPGFSFTVHGPEEYSRALSLKLSEKIAGSRFVCAISRFGRSQLQLFTPPELHDRIHIVHCGLDATFFDADGVGPPTGNRFLYVGRLCQQKQPLVMLEAAALLAQEGIDFHIDVIGDGELLAPVEASIGKHQLQDLVTLHGVAAGAEVRRRIRESLALLLPSSAEGLPVVIMESMAQHRPVITTFVAAIPELVRPGIDGWLAPSGNVRVLAEKMKEALAASPQELARMGNAAAERVRGRHDIRTSAQRMADLFRHYSDSDSSTP
jgi:glycosyltransferase involved in cell wall biosynthesis